MRFKTLQGGFFHKGYEGQILVGIHGKSPSSVANLFECVCPKANRKLNPPLF